jgi:hypothetical protein
MGQSYIIAEECMDSEDFKALLETVQRTEIAIARIEERQASVVDKLDISAKWQTAHETKDEERFANLNKYAASIAIVASGAGMLGSYVWNRLTGRT